MIGKLKADSASGDVSVEALVGDAVVSTASGDASVGALTGNLTFRAASGSLSVAAAVSGAVSVHSGSGDTSVGIVEGTAANLDLRSHSGAVRNALTPSDGPAEGEETLRVQVKTGSGDVSVQRATTAKV